MIIPRLFLLLCLYVLVLGAHAQRLETPNFSADIKVGCPEGHVSCDQLQARLLRKGGGQVITLRGRTLHTLCADGVTPCRFLGYVFSGRDRTYTLYDEGRLVIARGRTVMVDEKGQWQ